MNYDWNKSFTKGWTDESLWREYLEARDAKDFFAMDCAIRAQGAERRPVDSRVVLMQSKDLDLYEQMDVAPYAFDAPEKRAEYEQLKYLAQVRDVPLDQVDKSLDESLWKLSYFTHHIQIDPYVAGVDYMTDRDSYERVQAGFNPGPTAREGKLRPLRTGRDLATYVHTDDPMALWSSVIAELLDMKVPCKTEFDDMCREDSAFVTWGMPFWWGVIGEIIARVGPVNFRAKHKYMACRPEEYSMKMFGELLSMAFKEGSPMHGSYRAMHDVIARAIAAAIVYVFDNHYPIGDSNLRDEILLLGGNISDGRQWAAVHFEEDNRKGIPLATAIGERVVQEKLNEVGPRPLLV